MSLSKNYNNAFEFVKVIVQNIVNSFSHADTDKNGIFDRVTITSALFNIMSDKDNIIYGISFLVL